MLRIAVSWAQLQAGISRSIFEDVSTPLPHLEAKWLVSLRTFLDGMQGWLELDKDYVLPFQRTHDKFIMDEIIASNLFTPNEIKILNYCRLFLQALTISDLTLPGGIFLDPAMLSGHLSDQSSRTRMIAVNQGRPNNAAWKLWKKANRLWSWSNGKLIVPLQDWLLPLDEQRRQQTFCLDREEQILYCQSYDVITQHVKAPGRGGYHEEAYATTNEIPSHAIPAEAVSCPDNIIRIKSCKSLYENPVVPIPPSNFEDYLFHLEPWEAHLFHTLQWHAPIEEVLEVLTKDEYFLIASDGGVTDFHASFGWVLCSKDGDRLVSCSGPAFGYRPSSYRAEGYGILSARRFLIHLALFHDVKFGNCTHYCDNEGILKAIENGRDFDNWYPNATLVADWDVVYEIIQSLTHKNSCFVSFEHVKGHQDREKRGEVLPLSARLNIEADRLAGDYFRDMHTHTCQQAIRLSSNKAQLHVAGKGTITNHLKQVCRQSYSMPILKEYLHSKNCHWTNEVFDMIDWRAHSQTVARYRHQQNTLVKMLHDKLPVGSLTSLYDPKYPSHCPTCKEPNEDCNHLLRCPHESRQKWRLHFYSEVRKKAASLDTDPMLQEILVENLAGWIEEKPVEPVHDPLGKYQQLLQQQEAIGWGNQDAGCSPASNKQESQEQNRRSLDQCHH
jgi:hypothetical protein